VKLPAPQPPDPSTILWLLLVLGALFALTEAVLDGWPESLTAQGALVGPK